MKILLTALLFVFCFKSCSTEDMYITWEESPCLEWDDFQSKARPKNFNKYVAAVSVLSIHYTVKCVDGVFGVDAEAAFYPKQSWVRPGSDTHYILAHEQGHFDITYIYARKIEQIVEILEIPCTNVDILMTVIGIMMDEWDTINRNYDFGTQHSINQTAQYTWWEVIEKGLNIW